MSSPRRRGGAPPAALAAILAVVLGALVSLAARNRSGGGETAAPAGNPYLSDLDGAMARHARTQSRESLLSAGTGAPITAADARARPAAAGAAPSTAGARGHGTTLGARRGDSPFTSELGKEAAGLFANSDISVLALGHSAGSYAFSRTDGWLKLDGATWVVARYDELPADLQTAYPREVYTDPTGRPAAGAPPSGRGGLETLPPSVAGAGFPIEPEDAKVTLLPAPELELEPRERNRRVR